MRVHRRILKAVRHLGDCRPARRARGRPHPVPHRLGRRPSRRAGGRPGPRDGRHQPAGMARRQVLQLHRGAAARAARGRADLPGGGEISGRIHAPGHRGRPLGDVPVRRRSGDHRQAAQRGPAGARRPARHPATASGGPQPHPRIHRGVAADGEPGEKRFPLGAQGDHHRRRRHPRRHGGDDPARGRQPRPAPVREPTRIRLAAQERSRTHGVRPWRPLLSGRAAGPGRGTGVDRAHPGPDAAHRDQRNSPRSGRRPPLHLRADLHLAGVERTAPDVHHRGRVAPVG